LQNRTFVDILAKLLNAGINIFFLLNCFHVSCVSTEILYVIIFVLIANNFGIVSVKFDSALIMDWDDIKESWSLFSALQLYTIHVCQRPINECVLFISRSTVWSLSRKKDCLYSNVWESFNFKDLNVHDPLIWS